MLPGHLSIPQKLSGLKDTLRFNHANERRQAKKWFKNIFPTYPNIVCLVEIKTRSALSVFVAFPSATPFSASDGFQCRILAQRTEMKRYIAISNLTTLIS